MEGFSFSTEVRVRFAETDAQGVAHHAAFLVWLEVARVEYLERHAGGYQAIRDQGFEALTTEVGVRYRLAAYFDDRLTVWARCRRSARLALPLRVRDRPRGRARGGRLHESRRGRSRDASPDTRAAVARRGGRYGRVGVVVPPGVVVPGVVVPVVVPGGGGASPLPLGLGGAFVPTRTTVSSALYDVFHVS